MPELGFLHQTFGDHASLLGTPLLPGKATRVRNSSFVTHSLEVEVFCPSGFHLAFSRVRTGYSSGFAGTRTQHIRQHARIQHTRAHAVDVHPAYTRPSSVHLASTCMCRHTLRVVPCSFRACLLGKTLPRHRKTPAPAGLERLLRTKFAPFPCTDFDKTWHAYVAYKCPTTAGVTRSNSQRHFQNTRKTGFCTV